MAIVRTSGDIKTHVALKISSLYVDRLGDIEQKLKALPMNLPDMYYLMIDPWKHLMLQLPSCFFFNVRRVTLKSVAGVHLNLVLHSPSVLLFPRGFPEDYDVGVTTHTLTDTANVFIRDTPRWSVLTAHVLNTKARYDSVASQRDAASSAALALLDTHKTVNAAVQAWPSLRDLLSKEVCERLDAPVAKKSRETAQAASVSMEALSEVTSTLVKKKLGV